MTIRRSIQITLAVLALAGYLIVTVFSLFRMAHMANMDMPMGNCPYMVGQHSLCSTDAFAHLQSWHEYTSVPFSYFELLIAAAFIFAAFLAIEFSPPIFIPYPRQQRIIPLYQSLFSDGILHPKAP